MSCTEALDCVVAIGEFGSCQGCQCVVACRAGGLGSGNACGVMLSPFLGIRIFQILKVRREI